MSILSRVRTMPENQRVGIAFLAAIIITALIAIGWFMLTFTTPKTTQQPVNTASGETTQNPVY